MKPSIGGKLSKDCSRRRYPGIGGRRHNPVMIESKRKEALERNAKWAALSVREQLAALDRRFGEGQGAQKQRARLEAKLKAPAPAPVGTVVAAETSAPPGKLKAKDRREQERAASRAGK